MNCALLAALWLRLLMADPPDATSATATTDAAPESSGAALFRAAVAAYDGHEYARAADLFESAFRISHVPAILFDLGQTYRAMGDCRRALDSYDRFVRVAPPDDPLLARVSAHQAELQPCTDAAPAPVQPLPARRVALALPPPPVGAGGSAAAGPSQRAALTTTSPRAGDAGDGNGGRMKTACIAGSSAVAATGGAALGLGLKAWFVARDVEGRDKSDPGTQYDDARGKAYGDASLTLLVVTGVAAAVTAATCWFAWRNRTGAPGS